MQVCYSEDTVVLIASACQYFCIWQIVAVENIRITYHTVTGLEPDLWLEVTSINGSYHLERYIRAVEESCIVWTCSLVTYAYEVNWGERLCVGWHRIWIDINLDSTTVQSTSKAVTIYIGIESTTESWGEVEQSAHTESSGDIWADDDEVTLTTASFCTNYIAFALDLEG